MDLIYHIRHPNIVAILITIESSDNPDNPDNPYKPNNPNNPNNPNITVIILITLITLSNNLYKLSYTNNDLCLPLFPKNLSTLIF